MTTMTTILGGVILYVVFTLLLAFIVWAVYNFLGPIEWKCDECDDSASLKCECTVLDSTPGLLDCPRYQHARYQYKRLKANWYRGTK